MWFRDQLLWHRQRTSPSTDTSQCPFPTLKGHKVIRFQAFNEQFPFHVSALPDLTCRKGLDVKGDAVVEQSQCVLKLENQPVKIHVFIPTGSNGHPKRGSPIQHVSRGRPRSSCAFFWLAICLARCACASLPLCGARFTLSGDTWLRRPSVVAVATAAAVCCC